MNSHKFETQIAIDYDVATALLLETISFWLQINYNNKSKKHYHDGRWWLYNSYNSWTDLLPYYSPKQMRRIIENANKNDLILIGNYNKRKSDLTNWYTLTDKALCYFPILKEQILYTPAQTGKTPAQTGKTPAQTGKALPDTYPDTNPENNIYINARETEQKSTTTPVNDWHNHVGLYENQNGLQTTDTNLCTQEHGKDTYERDQLTIQSQLASVSSTGYQLTPYDSNTFERFWNLYPRKTGKERARAQWFHDGCHRKADEIIQQLQSHIEKDLSFLNDCVPNPCKYLIEKRYEEPAFKGNSKKKSHFDHTDTSWINKRDIFDD